MRMRELKKAERTGETCITCGERDLPKFCKCLGLMAKDDMGMEGGEDMAMSECCEKCGKDPCDCVEKKPVDETPAKSGSGGEVTKLGKAAVPMAKPPGGNPSPASPPMSKPAAPAKPKAVGAPVMKSEKVTLPGAPIAKALGERLAKAGHSFLGGKDPVSRTMSADALRSAPKPTATPMAAPAKTPVDHAARAASYADFTPQGPYSVKNGDDQGVGMAVAAPKPNITPAVAGMPTNHLARFHAAAGKKPGSPV